MILIALESLKGGSQAKDNVGMKRGREVEMKWICIGIGILNKIKILLNNLSQTVLLQIAVVFYQNHTPKLPPVTIWKG